MFTLRNQPKIINHRAMAAHSNCDPETNVQMVALQLEDPYLFPDYNYSSDSDAEDWGKERVQPETDAVLACLMPGCPRYFETPCRDALLDWCPEFKLRYLFCEWNYVTNANYAQRCLEGSSEFRLLNGGVRPVGI